MIDYTRKAIPAPANLVVILLKTVTGIVDIVTGGVGSSTEVADGLKALSRKKTHARARPRHRFPTDA